MTTALRGAAAGGGGDTLDFAPPGPGPLDIGSFGAAATGAIGMLGTCRQPTCAPEPRPVGTALGLDVPLAGNAGADCSSVDLRQLPLGYPELTCRQ